MGAGALGDAEAAEHPRHLLAARLGREGLDEGLRAPLALDLFDVQVGAGEGKTGGAFNLALLLPSGDARAYNFLNYLGSTRDVMTVAHEAGHGAHGMLAAEAQGALMFRAPMVYAETASIFGEMTTFRFLLERARSDEERLALLMEKSADHINTVVRQISFSNFEQRVHAARRDGKAAAAGNPETSARAAITDARAPVRGGWHGAQQTASRFGRRDPRRGSAHRPENPNMRSEQPSKSRG